MRRQMEAIAPALMVHAVSDTGSQAWPLWTEAVGRNRSFTPEPANAPLRLRDPWPAPQQRRAPVADANEQPSLPHPDHPGRRLRSGPDMGHQTATTVIAAVTSAPPVLCAVSVRAAGNPEREVGVDTGAFSLVRKVAILHEHRASPATSLASTAERIRRRRNRGMRWCARLSFFWRR